MVSCASYSGGGNGDVDGDSHRASQDAAYDPAEGIASSGAAADQRQRRWESDTVDTEHGDSAAVLTERPAEVRSSPAPEVYDRAQSLLKTVAHVERPQSVVSRPLLVWVWPGVTGVGSWCDERRDGLGYEGGVGLVGEVGVAVEDVDAGVG